ncbi:MAG: hypothetical protein ACE366_06295 [Bradymonadia bacterium]
MNTLNTNLLVCAAALTFTACGEANDEELVGLYPEGDLTLVEQVDTSLTLEAVVDHHGQFEGEIAARTVTAADFEAAPESLFEHQWRLTNGELGDGFSPIEEYPSWETEPPTHGDDTGPASLIYGDICTFTQFEYKEGCSSHENAACVLSEHFDMLYPDGFKVTRGVNFEFTSFEAFMQAMPAGGKSEAIRHSVQNPRASEANRLAVELAVLETNIALNEAGKLGTMPFADIKIASGPLAGYSVGALADTAHWILGGSEHLASEMGMDLEEFADVIAGLNAAGQDCEPASYVSP